MNEALQVYNNVKNRPKENRIKPESCITMVKVLYNVLKYRDKLLKDKSFAQYQQYVLKMIVELFLT